MPQDNDIFAAYRHQNNDHERAHEQHRADEKDVSEGQQQGNEQVPPAHRHAVQENH